VRKFILDEVSSTQDTAFDLLDRFPRVLVMARKQHAGRGRRGHTWLSEEGGLYASFGWKGLDMERALLLNLIAPVSLVETLENYGIKAGIKLPNDIFAEGKKIGGVLIESRGDKTVLGIGLNINQTRFPPNIEATSMKLLTGRSYREDDVLDTLTSRLEANMNLPPQEVAELFSKYMIRGRVKFRYRGKTIEDTIIRVNANLEAEGLSGNYLLPWMEDVRYTQMNGK